MSNKKKQLLLSFTGVTVLVLGTRLALAIEICHNQIQQKVVGIVYTYVVIEWQN